MTHVSIGSPPEGSSASLHRDVVVVGDGLVGLACALELADDGARVGLVGAELAGQASAAAAGMLAPSVERSSPLAYRAGVAARDGYPAYLARLEECTGISVPLDRKGVLQVALDEREGAALRAEAAAMGLAGASSRWLEAPELARLEPALTHAAGALLHPDDGSVDNRRLLEALRLAVARHPRIVVVDATAATVELDGASPGIRLSGGELVRGEWGVLAAGAWTPRIGGLPHPLPIEPVRGQMIALQGVPLGRVVYGAGGYLVPRAGCTWAGSTMERVGFDHGTTEPELVRLRVMAAAICPALHAAPVLEQWAGIRPVTPDLLPMIGPSRSHDRLLLACGHSRNGVLLAPLTGACIAALVRGAAPPVDLTPFAPARFGA